MLEPGITYCICLELVALFSLTAKGLGNIEEYVEIWQAADISTTVDLQ